MDIAAIPAALDAGLDPNAESELGHTLLAEAVHYRAHQSVLDALIAHGASVNSGGSSGYLPLAAAVRRYVPALDILLHAGADPNTRTVGSAPLPSAAFDARPVWFTPLADALCVGPGSLSRLLKAGGDAMNAVEDASLLRLACERAYSECFDYLLARGWRDETIGSSLHLSAAAGWLERVQAHLRHGVPVDTPDEHMRTALSMAVCADRPSIVAELLAWGADPTQTVRWRWGPTMLGCGVDSEYPGMGIGTESPRIMDIVRSESAALMLLEAGADLHAEDPSSDGYRPPVLNALAESGKIDIVCALVQSGAHVDVSDRAGRTPLHVFALQGNEMAIRRLVGLGASVDARDTDGETPLMYAAANACPSTVSSLLWSGASTERRDDEGWTALDHACTAAAELADPVTGGADLWESAIAPEATVRLLQGAACDATAPTDPST